MSRGTGRRGCLCSACPAGRFYDSHSDRAQPAARGHRGLPVTPSIRGLRATLLLRAGALILAAAGVLTLSCSTDPATAWALPVASASATGPRLQVTGAYVPQPASPDVAAAYLIIHNAGDRADRLISVRSDVSDEVMLHETRAGKMVHLAGLEVPAHGSATLAPKGIHLMLMEPKRQLRRGDRVQLTLVFAASGPMRIDAPVLGIGERPVTALP